LHKNINKNNYVKIIIYIYFMLHYDFKWQKKNDIDECIELFIFTTFIILSIYIYVVLNKCHLSNSYILTI